MWSRVTWGSHRSRSQLAFPPTRSWSGWSGWDGAGRLCILMGTGDLASLNAARLVRSAFTPPTAYRASNAARV